MIVRNWVSWSRPALTSTVEWLLDRFPVEKGKAVDLSAVLLLTQTTNAARRIREALVWEVQNQGGSGLFPPRTGTPYSLLRPRFDGPCPMVTELQSISLWCKVFARQDFRQMPALFPKPAALGDSSSILDLARSMESLRGSLTEAGLDCRGVIDSNHCHDGELRRWENLAMLEEQYLNEVDQFGWVDPRVLQLTTSASPTLPDGVTQLIVVGVSDLAPLMQTALSNLAQNVDIQLIFFGPKGAGDNAFNDWGRPLPEYWGRQQLVMDDSQIHLSADEGTQSRDIAEFFKKQRAGCNQPRAALGVADSNLTSTIHRALSVVEVRAYEPAGRPAQKHELYAFLKGLLDVLRHPAYHFAENLLRMPMVQKMVGCESVANLLSGLDLLRTKAIPATLTDAVAVIPDKIIPRGGAYAWKDNPQRELVTLAVKALKKLGDLLKEFHSQTLAEFLQDLFTTIDLSGLGDTASLGEVLECLHSSVAELHDFRKEGGNLDSRLQLQLVVEYLSKLFIAEKHDAEAIELQGWLELLWEPSPHLLLAGFQEKAVPESITGDMFLPETLRLAIGLQGNDDRLARDIWQCACLLASRRDEGRVDFLISRTSDKGDPLLPSRLLFLCKPENLATRVDLIFRELPKGKSLPPWTVPWKLNPLPKREPSGMSVTSFKSYLDCPFMYLLNRELGMDEVEVQKVDLDPGEFGTLLHSVLENLIGDMGRCTGVDELVIFFHEKLMQIMTSRYGHLHSAPLQAQVAAARARLELAAFHQAGIAGDGWEIKEVEHQIKYKLGGIKITGYIDRIDYHSGMDRWRVIDYKTSATGKEPDKVHHGFTSRVQSLQESPAFTKFEFDDKESAWKDLQLPLYILALQELHPGKEVEGAYFNLPDSDSNAGIKQLTTSSDVLDSARDCALGVIEAAIEKRKFWPMRRKLSFFEESYKRLLFHDIEKTIMEPDRVGKEASR
jgi:ATP-dependent helicase/nuclease subunit B